MVATPNPILDRPVRFAMSVRVDVLDARLDWQGTLKPERVGEVSATSDARVKRQWTGVVLTEYQMRDLDIYGARFRPAVVLEDGTSWPLGVFLMTANPHQLGSIRDLYSCSFLDVEFTFDQKSRETFSVPSGGWIYDALNRLYDAAGIYERRIDVGLDARAHEPLAWPAGTSHAEIGADLASRAGCLPPHTTAEGLAIVRRATPLDQVTVSDHVYETTGTAGRVLRGPAPVDNDNLLSAPTTHVVRGTGAIPASAVAEVDPLVPWSQERRGFGIVDVHDFQGLGGTPGAQAAADAAAAADPTAFREVEFTGIPDPRHGLFDVVQFDGELFRETSWRMGLDPGGRTHTHTLSRNDYLGESG